MSQQAGNILDDPALLFMRQRSAYPPQRQPWGANVGVTTRVQMGTRNAPHILNHMYGPTHTSHLTWTNPSQGPELLPLQMPSSLAPALPLPLGVSAGGQHLPLQTLSPSSPKRLTRSQAHSAVDSASPSSSKFPPSPGPAPASPSRPPRVTSDLAPDKPQTSPRKRGRRSTKW